MVLGFYGASGLGAEYCDYAKEINELTNRWSDYVFVDDDKKDGSTLLGHRIIKYQQAIDEFGKDGIEFVISIGEPAIKDSVFNKLEQDKCTITSLIHPNIKITLDKVIGKGLVLKQFSILPPLCVFGNNVLVQSKACLGHNLVLGDNVVISSLSFVGGDVTIGRNSFIAAGALVRNGITIGANAIVGMGAVVVKDVPDNAVVVGNPAKIIRYNEKQRVFSK